MKGFKPSLSKAGAITLAVVLLGLPFALARAPFFAFVFGVTLIHVLWTAGMNLLYGYAGLMPLMFAGIAGISAYATVDLMTENGWSFWTAMALSSIMAAAVGVVLGLPALRLRGFYFTLCSLVIQTVLTLAFISFPRFTNGDTGISQIPAPSLPLLGSERLGSLDFNLILGGFALLGVLGAARLIDSAFGRRLIATREDDLLSETLGIDVVRAKVAALFVGSLYAAVGGALYAAYLGFISPRSFDVLASLNIWLMVAFGGRGTIFGPIIGTAALVPIPFILQDYYMLKDIVYGALIIIVIMIMPAGIVGELIKVRRLVKATRKPLNRNGEAAS